MLVQGLSTGHKVGLALMAAGFAGFSLLVALYVPRRRPQFPGRGLGFFVVVCVLLFAGMVTAVVIFGRESGGEARAAGHEATTTRHGAKPGAHTVKVSEVEWKIKLPQTTFAPGTYTFDVSNDGKVPHNLTVQGPAGTSATPNLAAGASGTLKVDLKAGTYDFFCSVPGHKQLGMDDKVTVS